MQMHTKKGLRLKVRRGKEGHGQALQDLCEACQGRGWVYIRAYETCPDCNGAGIWAETKTAEASNRQKASRMGQEQRFRSDPNHR